MSARPKKKLTIYLEDDLARALDVDARLRGLAVTRAAADAMRRIYLDDKDPAVADTVKMRLDRVEKREMPPKGIPFDDAARAYGFSEMVAFQIKAAASEAVSNAIEHGSAGPHDVVALEAVEEEGAFALYVRDSGSFRPRVSARGDLPERGRGLQFLGQMMDEVDVRPGARGTEVRMLRRL